MSRNVAQKVACFGVTMAPGLSEVAYTPGFLSAFCPRAGGGKMRLYGLLGGGGGQVCIHVQSMWQTRGGGGMLPGKFFLLDLLLDAIWWNLGLFSHTLPFIVSLKFL